MACALLLFLSAAFAVPKAYSDVVEVLAVAPDGHRVLLGTLGSFEEWPRNLVERNVVTGAEAPVDPEVERAFASCDFDTPCAPLDVAWTPGAWVAWNRPSPVVARWVVTTVLEGRWYTSLADSCEPGPGVAACRAYGASGTVDVVVEDGDVRVVIDRATSGERSARLSRARLARLGVRGDTYYGVRVVRGADGVLVLFPGVWAAEGLAQPPPMVFVLPTR